MTETIRMTDTQPDNVALTGDKALATAVQSIDLDKKSVRFALQPVFAGIEEAPGAQPASGHGGKIIVLELGDDPESVLIEGIVYRVRVKRIGTMAAANAICDFEVTTTLA